MYGIFTLCIYGSAQLFGIFIWCIRWSVIAYQILSQYFCRIIYIMSGIQYCLAYAIGLAGYYRSINLMEVITGIFRRKTDMHAQKLNKQMGCVLLILV